MHVCLDLGGGYVKAGVGDTQVTVANCTATQKRQIGILVADQTETESGNVRHSELSYSRPLERGYLTDPDGQIEILERVFKDHLKVNPGATNIEGVVVTEAPLAPQESRTYLDEIIFEHFGFKSRIKENAASLCVFANSEPKSPQKATDLNHNVSLLVDFGYSFTLVTPVICGVPFYKGIKRLDIGGKFLTNSLKEVVSYRHFNLVDDTHVIEMARRKACYVSLDFRRDLDRSMSKFRAARDEMTLGYVLPNYHNVLSGYTINVQEARSKDMTDVQMLELNSERFIVPELYFNPMDIGLNQAGVHEVIEQSIALCPEEVQDQLRRNIIIAGGNAKTPNLISRLSQELGPRYCVKKSQSKHQSCEDIAMHPLQGMLKKASLCKRYYASNDPDVERLSKQQYEDEGPHRR